MKVPGYVPRLAAGLVVLLIAALTYPGAVAVSMIVRLTPSPTGSSQAAQSAMSWLHVAHPQDGQPYIADDRGSLVLLHGAISAGLIDFWSGTDRSRIDTPPFYPIDPAAYANQCPDNSRLYHYPALCQADLAQMAALGFNSLRLPLSWSLLEPQRGRFSQTYVDRVAQVVDWARALGMYVIIDMHENAYSRFVGRTPNPPLGGSLVDLSALSGAPAWATLTDGIPSEVFASQREVNPAVFEANSNFWYNRNGIQDEYIATLALLAKRFKDDSTVAGYSVFNEPWPGWNLPPGFDDLLLFPFYRRVIDALTGVHDGLPCPTGIFMPAICGYQDLGVHDLRHLFFLDTGLAREVTDFPTHLGLPVSSYPNLVLGIHTYTHGYTFDALAHQKPDHATYPWGGYDQSYALADREAKAMNTAVFVAEFGNSPEWDGVILANELLEQERHVVGFAFWTWMENGGSGSWGVFDPPSTGASPMPSSGCIRTERERLLARVYPRSSADPSLSYHYDAATGAFYMQARGRQGDAPTVVFIPHEVTGEVDASGGVANFSIGANPDGSRLVTATPSGRNFSIQVAGAPLALTVCP